MPLPTHPTRRHFQTYLYYVVIRTGSRRHKQPIAGRAFSSWLQQSFLWKGALPPYSALHLGSSLASATFVRGTSCYFVLTETTFSSHPSICCCLHPSYSFLLRPLAAYFTVSPLFSWPCLYHLLDHDAVHFIEIFCADMQWRRPYSIFDGYLLPPKARCAFV